LAFRTPVEFWHTFLQMRSEGFYTEGLATLKAGFLQLFYRVLNITEQKMYNTVLFKEECNQDLIDKRYAPYE
jgi:hypothetical protein